MKPLMLLVLPATLLLGLVPVASQATAAPDVTVRSVLLPGGVADPDGKIGYVTNEKGGINALDLESGRILWTREAPGKPLVVFDNKLAVQIPVKDKQNQVRIEILDVTAKGKQLRESDPVVFPDWVAVDQVAGRRFSSSAFVQGKNLYLKWDARSFYYRGGAAPTKEMVKAETKNATGLASIDLESGKVKTLDKEKFSHLDEPKIPEELRKVTSDPYYTGTEELRKSIVVGNTMSALVRETTADGSGKLSLKTWDIKTGKAREPIKLSTGGANALIPSGSKYVFVFQPWLKESCLMFSLETGKLERQISPEIHEGFKGGAKEQHFVGPRFFCAVSAPSDAADFTNPQAEKARKLKSVDLKTGKTLWESPIQSNEVPWGETMQMFVPRAAPPR